MSKRLTDDQCREAQAAFLATGGNAAAAARSLGLDRCTFKNRRDKYFLRGLDRDGLVGPGMEIAGETRQFDADGNLTGTTVKTTRATSDDEFQVPEGHEIAGVSAYTDADGRVSKKWVKTRWAGLTEAEVHESYQIAAERIANRTENDAPVNLYADFADQDTMVLFPLADLHLGLYAWGRETGTAWDLETALQVYRLAMRNVMACAPVGAEAVILGGGDLLHADDEEKKTRRSGHVLDVDTRYPKVLAAAEDLMVFQVDLALTKFAKVRVRILPGNHDDDSSVAVSHFLRAWYRNDPRVVVDASPGPFWHYDWGRTMLSGTHGHKAKIDKMHGVMACDRPAAWGLALHRYAHGFHIHHKTAGEAAGVRWETHQTPVARDSYAHDHAYRSGRSLCAIAYHKERGESIRVTESLDAVSPLA